MQPDNQEDQPETGRQPDRDGHEEQESSAMPITQGKEKRKEKFNS